MSRANKAQKSTYSDSKTYSDPIGWAENTALCKITICLF